MLLRLALAAVYDLLIIFALLMLTTAACMLANHRLPIPPGSLWHQLSLVLTIVLYYVVCLKLGGQTIGLKAWRLQVVSAYSSLTLFQVLFWLILSLPALGFSAIRFKSPQYFLYKWTSLKLTFLKRSP